jgi:SNF2 family DNA or RNA helicase
MVEQLIGKRISLPEQFTGTVTVEAAEIIEDTVQLLVRTVGGEIREAFLELDRLQTLLEQDSAISNTFVDANSFFLFIEAARIKTAFAYDPHDPGAGKTIMAGLLVKELKLRHALDRILILAPAPLTIQWQDELRSKFSETFAVINSNLVKNQMAGNPWARFRQCIASIDFAKRDDVISSILQVDWDLVIIDEAHKCSARTQGDELRRTGRYKLAEELSQTCERILLLTATPHQGDVEQFHNFLRLLDQDQFISNEVNPKILQLQDSPWFLRWIKEELTDFEGRKLFKNRHPITVPFELSNSEEYLYKQVTKYINRYLGKTVGKKQAAVALARTVLQRRLASSLKAIYSSLTKRERRFADLLEELAKLSPSEQHQRLMNLGRIVDPEQDSDDCEAEDLEVFAIESTVAEQLEQLQEELFALKQLVKLAQQTIELGAETKLNALRKCLEGTELNELKDGLGKLLIFTEHRDTLNYLKENLMNWTLDKKKSNLRKYYAN